MNLRNYSYRHATHCVYCQRKFVEPNMGNRFLEKSKDHIIARVKGGPNHTDNYIASCKQCNEMKSGRTLLEFAQFLEDKIKYILNPDPLDKLRINNLRKLYNKTSWLHKKYPGKNLV